MTSVSTDAVVERIQLDDTSWVDVARNWITEPDELYEALLNGVDWRESKVYRYEKFVDERRLGSGWSLGRPLPHPSLAAIHKDLQRRYKATFPGFGMIQYRNAGDGQGFHRDTDMRWLDDTIIAILTLGAQRPWLLRPRAVRNSMSSVDGLKGATHDLAPGSGDLIVMGGACQANWEHSVPYLNKLGVGVRISLQWRYARKVGKPFMGPGYSAPVTYSSNRYNG